ncbi:MAG: hypothetical protein JXB10_00355 [Pirellulales bacterium]|nr:hypothetical protein [Pirellulales bacterium]
MMQLDHYRIAIRQRSYVDVLDLALRVLRTHAAPLTGLFILGVVPMALFNAYLLQNYLEPETELDIPLTYLWYMLLLVLIEAPLATAAITLYLGEALFQKTVSPRKIARDLIRTFPQMFFFQVLLRIPLIRFVAPWFLLFGVWPYLSEVILLERNPFFRRRRGAMTTIRRLRVLHRGMIGELTGRWMVSMALGGLLFASWGLTFWGLGGMLFNQWEPQGPVYTVFYPAALWLTIGFFTMTRYLSYLDLRIRREGWEVELLMRAEGARLNRQRT